MNKIEALIKELADLLADQDAESIHEAFINLATEVGSNLDEFEDDDHKAEIDLVDEIEDALNDIDPING